MKYILLLGAGFSRNWGGLLSNEVFEFLIGQKEIAGNSDLKNLLWKHSANGDFENALAEIQTISTTNPANHYNFQLLQTAVSNVFERMNKAFFDIANLEFQEDAKQMLRTFLVRFDAIFTLNQDVLLEHHYFPNINLTEGAKWKGTQLPGMERIPHASTNIDTSWGKDTWIPLQNQEFQLEDNFQPCFKFNGSSNWKDSEGGSLLVIRGNKSTTIQSHAVLIWYFEKFSSYLSDPNCKLFVIGYGFRDPHVNQEIINAVNKGLKFFIIDPSGSDVVQQANSSFGGAIYACNDLDDAFKTGLIGASRRSLSETFGNDRFSHENIMSFFD
jgi:SIR2-like domain